MPKCPQFEEKMFVSYKDMSGQIVHIGNHYMTFTPSNSKAILLIYKNDWSAVTVMEVSQTP